MPTVLHDHFRFRFKENLFVDVKILQNKIEMIAFTCSLSGHSHKSCWIRKITKINHCGKLNLTGNVMKKLKNILV